MRTTPRPRRHLGPVAFSLMRPVLRYSITRDAYVLRLIGGRLGPVIRRGPDPARVDAGADASVPRGG